jgi:hypothetical protein
VIGALIAVAEVGRAGGESPLEKRIPILSAAIIGPIRGTPRRSPSRRTASS